MKGAEKSGKGLYVEEDFFWKEEGKTY